MGMEKKTKNKKIEDPGYWSNADSTLHQRFLAVLYTILLFVCYSIHLANTY